MQRSEKIGLGVALAGHVVLFGLLSVGFLATPNPEKLKPAPINVSLVDDVGLTARAPQATEAPAEAKAPELGAPEDAPPPAEQREAEPDPVPPAPQPKAAPPPKPAPKAPSPPKKVVAARPDKAKAPPSREAAPASSSKAAARGTGSDRKARSTRPRGSILDPSFEKGLGIQPTQSKSQVAQAPAMDQRAMTDIATAIIRQVQPCADRQVKPGPGAERIRVTIRLRLNRDGTLVGNPQVIDHDGVDAENRRYMDRVDDNAIATFKGCSPLRGLPPDLYDVQNGWSDFKLRYKLPG